MAFRRHYLNELSLVKAREVRREKEEMSEVVPGFLEEVRLRNRLDRLRRACREQISADQEVATLLESGPSSLQEPVPSYILEEEADPLPLGTSFRTDQLTVSRIFHFVTLSETV